MGLGLDYKGSGGELEKQATLGGKTIVTYPDGGLQVCHTPIPPLAFSRTHLGYGTLFVTRFHVNRES